MLAATVHPTVAQEIKPTEQQLVAGKDLDQQRLVETYSRMYRYYERRNFNSQRSVRILLSNYPQHVTPILAAAFDRYPMHYRHIMRAAIHAEPAFTSEIVSIALQQQIADPADIVKIAVEAEPSYADTIVNLASDNSPSAIHELVKVAVLVEPATADTILRGTNVEDLTRFELVLRSLLDAVPTLTQYLSQTVADLIAGDSAQEEVTDYSESQERARAVALLRSAHRAGIPQGDLELIATRYNIAETEYVD